MKKLVSFMLLVALILSLPSLSMAKGKKRRHALNGEVTAVTDKTITIQEGKKAGGAIKTIFVPAGIPIDGKSASPSSASASASSTSGGPPPTLSGLVGKHVRVKESTAGTASEITVIEPKGKKKKKA